MFNFGSLATPQTKNTGANDQPLSVSQIATPAPANSSFLVPSTPTPSFNFGGGATSSGSTTTSFNAPLKTEPAPATSFTFANPSLQTGGSTGTSFSLAPSKEPQTASTATTNAASFSFGTAQKSSQSAMTGSSSASTQPQTFSFAASKPDATATQDRAKTSTPSTSLSFGLKPADDKPPSVPTFSLPTKPISDTPKPDLSKTTQDQSQSASVSVDSAEISAQLKGKSIQDLLNEWQKSFNSSVSSFHLKAAEIAQLDSVLLDQSEKILGLNSEALELVKLQDQITHTLDYVESQQSQLGNNLDAFEERLRVLVEDSHVNNFMRNASFQSVQEIRESTYNQAENVSFELLDISARLNELMDFVNKQYKRNEEENGSQTISTLIKVMNEHYDSLKWIDDTSSVLKARLDSVRQLKN